MARNLYLSLIFLSCSFANAATIFTFDSSPESWVGHGESRYITPADGYTFNVSSNFDNGLNFQISHSATSGDPLHDHWSLRFAAPFQNLLSVGLYENTARFPFQDEDQAGLTFSGNHRGNNKNGGFFEVLEIEYDQFGVLEKFAADFTQYGEENELWWSTGSIRYNSDIAVVPVPAALYLFSCSLLALFGIKRSRV